MKNQKETLATAKLGRNYFIADHTGAMNRVTVYRRTRYGITNLVTGKRTSFSANLGLQQRECELV